MRKRGDVLWNLPLLIEFERYLEDGVEGVDDADDNDDAADDAVHDDDAIGADAVFHACQCISEPCPPEHCPCNDAHEAEQETEDVRGYGERQLGIEGNEEEYDKGIGEGDEEGGEVVVEESSLLP